jgi:hypothetical protein
MQMSLSVGVARIFATDLNNLSKRLRASQKRGVSFDGISQYSVLTKSLKVSVQCARRPFRWTVSLPFLLLISADEDFVAFFCGHIYHKACLLDPEDIEAINASRIKGLKSDGVANKITEAALLKPYLTQGCEICGTLDDVKHLDKGKRVVGIR